MERINGTADFQDAMVIDKLASLKNAVCRITLNGQGFGTGFLVADNIVLTNNHVIPDVATAMELKAEFGYELDSNKKLKDAVTCNFRPDLFFYTSSIYIEPGNPLSGLDFTLVAVETHGDCGRRVPENTPPGG